MQTVRWMGAVLGLTVVGGVARAEVKDPLPDSLSLAIQSNG